MKHGKSQSFESIMNPEKREGYYVRSKVPHWDRGSCEYNSTFKTHRMKEQFGINDFARERVKLAQEVRDVRGIGRLASAADTTTRSSFPPHPVQPKPFEPGKFCGNPRYAKYTPTMTVRTGSLPHISGLVGNPNEWSPRTLHQIAISTTPGVRPSTETRRRAAPMDTTTNHMVEFAAEQYKKHIPDKITKAKPSESQ